MLLKFWLPWSVDALVAAIGLYLFLEGIADHTVSPNNIGLWLTLLFCLAGVIGGSLWLKAIGQKVASSLLAYTLALPACLAGLFLLFLVIEGGPHH